MGYMSAGAASTVQEYACEPSVHAPKSMARNPLQTCSDIFTVSQYRRQSHGLHLVQCNAWAGQPVHVSKDRSFGNLERDRCTWLA